MRRPEVCSTDFTHSYFEVCFSIIVEEPDSSFVANSSCLAEQWVSYTAVAGKIVIGLFNCL